MPQTSYNAPSNSDTIQEDINAQNPPAKKAGRIEKMLNKAFGMKPAIPITLEEYNALP